MAGRPKRRAQLAAPAWVEATLQDNPFADPEPQAPPDAPTTDRERLRDWWAEELASIERSLVERRALLEGAGAHPSEVVAREVLAFGARGIPKDVAAVLLGMAEGELELHYGSEYAAGCAEVIARAAQNMMRIATSTNDRVAVKALTEFLNRRGGEEWRPPAQKLEIADDRKGRGRVIDASTLSYEERQALRAKILERRVETQGVAVGLLQKEADYVDAE